LPLSSRSLVDASLLSSSPLFSSSAAALPPTVLAVRPLDKTNDWWSDETSLESDGGADMQSVPANLQGGNVASSDQRAVLHAPTGANQLEAPPAAASSEWTKHHTDDRVPYYVSAVTGESRWDCLSESLSSTVPLPASAEQIAAAAAQALHSSMMSSSPLFSSSPLLPSSAAALPATVFAVRPLDETNDWRSDESSLEFDGGADMQPAPANLQGDDAVGSDQRAVLHAPVGANQLETSPAAASSEWTQYHNDDGVPYYVSAVTGESRWDCPS
jgi:hypothetical protein